MSKFTIIPNNNTNLVYVQFVPADRSLPNYVPEDDLIFCPIVAWFVPSDPDAEILEPYPVGPGLDGDEDGAVLNLEDDRWYIRQHITCAEGREGLLAELKRLYES